RRNRGLATAIETFERVGPAPQRRRPAGAAAGTDKSIRPSPFDVTATAARSPAVAPRLLPKTGVRAVAVTQAKLYPTGQGSTRQIWEAYSEIVPVAGEFPRARDIEDALLGSGVVQVSHIRLSNNGCWGRSWVSRFEGPRLGGANGIDALGTRVRRRSYRRKPHRRRVERWRLSASSRRVRGAFVAALPRPAGERRSASRLLARLRSARTGQDRFGRCRH